MQKLEIGANQAGQRFDKFLKKYFPGAGTGFLYRMLRKKNITLNGKKAEGKEILQTGDTVETFFSRETFDKLRTGAFRDDSGPETGQGAGQGGEQGPGEPGRDFDKVRVIYGDRNLLALYKPQGVASQSGNDITYSLNEWLVDYCRQMDPVPEGMGQGFMPSVCNRLDRNTTGLVLCGISMRLK